MVSGSVDVTSTEYTFPEEKRTVCSSFLQAADCTFYKFLSSRSCTKFGVTVKICTTTRPPLESSWSIQGSV